MGATRASRVGRHGVRLVALVMTVLVAAVVVAVVAVGARTAWQDGRLNGVICDGDCGPGNVTAPEGLAVAAPAGSAPSGPTGATRLDPDAVAAAVRPLLDDPLLGDHVGFAASAPTADAPIVTEGDGTFTPASTTKLLTGLAALQTLDPQARFATRVVESGDGVVLVGGGDPHLTVRRDKDSTPVDRAQLAVLARLTAAALREGGRTSVTLGFDDGLFTGPSASPGWESDYVPGNIVTPVSALWVDQGVVDGIRSRTPAQSAAGRFASLLRDEGIDVVDGVDRTSTSDSAPALAVVRSATVAQIVEDLVRTSDNQAAEVVLRHVAIGSDLPGSFDGGTEAVAAALDRAGIDTTGLQLFDGSGLSRRNLISPTTLVEVVRTALATPRGAALVGDLPISGYSGTLTNRFDRATSGLVRAKTGTLTGVHSLAGYALDADGRPVVFAVMTDRADRPRSLAAQAAVDDVVAAIAACRCG